MDETVCGAELLEPESEPVSATVLTLTTAGLSSSWSLPKLLRLTLADLFTTALALSTEPIIERRFPDRGAATSSSLVFMFRT